MAGASSLGQLFMVRLMMDEVSILIEKSIGLMMEVMVNLQKFAVFLSGNQNRLCQESL